jgi:GNAT superfamily N-acetyltransferase
MRIVELTSEIELLEAYPVMHQLRTQHQSEAEYLDLLRAMIPRGYRLFAVREDDGTIMALAGVTIDVNFYDLRHVFVYDLVTAEAARSKGYGKALMDFLESFARDHDCHTITLSSGVQRLDAHRFYEQKVGMERKGYVFRKVIE